MKISVLLFAVICSYTILVLSIIYWGIPNFHHPFTYHMDEWHQLMAVRGVFTQGSANIPGAAHGPLFQFFLSGIFLGPFYIFRIIDPFAVKSSLGNLEAQETLFMVLRLNSLLFGVLSIGVLWQMAKKYLHINPFITVFFFTFTPIWIMLSNYFKYDIALMFWLLLTLYALLWYNEAKNKKIFFFTGFLAAITLATKISALPIIPVYGFAYFLFTSKKSWRIKDICIGFGIFVTTFFLFGIPDFFLGTGDYYEYFYSNLVATPKATDTVFYGMPSVIYLPITIFPLLFGHTFYFSLLVMGIYIGHLFLKRKVGISPKNKKVFLFLVSAFLLFVASLIPLKVSASGNRSLVLLPFFALFLGFCIDLISTKLKKNMKGVLYGVIGLMMLIQIGEVLLWTSIKWLPDPRVTSSKWLKTNISPTQIGIENIPIYQFLPDLVLKEFYLLQNNPKAQTTYTYLVIDEKTKVLPKAIIISHAAFEANYFKDSPKKRLLRRLQKEGYIEVEKFDLPSIYYQYFKTERELFITGLVPYAPLSIFMKK